MFSCLGGVVLRHQAAVRDLPGLIPGSGKDIYAIYVSPHEMGRHIVFSSVVCLTVCLSVCPSRFRVRSISFEQLVGFHITLHKFPV